MWKPGGRSQSPYPGADQPAQGPRLMRLRHGARPKPPPPAKHRGLIADAAAAFGHADEFVLGKIGHGQLARCSGERMIDRQEHHQPIAPDDVNLQIGRRAEIERRPHDRDIELGVGERLELLRRRHLPQLDLHPRIPGVETSEQLSEHALDPTRIRESFVTEIT